MYYNDFTYLPFTTNVQFLQVKVRIKLDELN